MNARALDADPSQRPLSEVARHLVIPTGIVDSVWFDLEERFEEWGVNFDRWQDSAGQILLGVRDDGKYAATVGGATWSIPRQVAKTFLISRAVFALSTHLDDQTWLWTAHRTRTATQTFQKLAGFAQSKRVKPYLASNRNDGIRTANGEQEIEFRNGSRILFGAREQGFGRGFDEVDGEVFDEGQILTEKALEDMVPAANQSRNPHGALLIFMGTPPRPVDPGEVLKSRRRKALAAKPDDVVMVEHGDAFYLECSADPETGRPGGPELDDPVQIAKANPSYPHRTPPESIARMRENLPSDDAWRREALGIWDSDAEATRAIPVDVWDDLGVAEAPKSGLKAFAVAFSVDGTRLSLGGAMRTDESVHVELVDAFAGSVAGGIGPLADWLAARWRDTCGIVLSGRAGASVLAQALRERKVPEKWIVMPSTPQVFQACGMFLEATRDGSVTHLASEGQAALDESVAVVDRHARGRDGAWSWRSTVPGGDETPVEAVSFAYWLAKTSKMRARGGGDERKVVIL